MRHTPSKQEALRREREAVRFEIERARLAQTRPDAPDNPLRATSYTEWHRYRPLAPSAERDHVVAAAEKKFYHLILEVLENLLTFYDHQCAQGRPSVSALMAELQQTHSLMERASYFRESGFASPYRFYNSDWDKT